MGNDISSLTTITRSIIRFVKKVALIWVDKPVLMCSFYRKSSIAFTAWFVSDQVRNPEQGNHVVYGG